MQGLRNKSCLRKLNLSKHDRARNVLHTLDYWLTAAGFRRPVVNPKL